jgi:hypothetical protein
MSSYLWRKSLIGMLSRIVTPKCSGRESVFACLAGSRGQVVETERVFIAENRLKRQIVSKIENAVKFTALA